MYQDNTINQTSWEKRQEKHKRWIKSLWKYFGIGTICLLLFFFLLSKTSLPSFEELQNPNTFRASEIFAADGSIVGRYYSENRVPVEYDKISPNVINALIATEDERFYDHSGIDAEALGRVVFKTLIGLDQSSGGGSTITQQLAKMLFTGVRANNIFGVVIQKLKEWIVAVRLERTFTKEEILALYLNKFDFLHGGQGINTAAEIYFKITPDKLNIQQSSTLVGMLKNPTLYNPIRFPDTTLHRRMVVMKQMVKANKLSSSKYDSLKVLPLGIDDFVREDQSDGLAPYFRAELSKTVKEILAQKEASTGKKYDVYRDGLKIYTSIDPNIQRIAEKAVWDNMSKLQKRFDQHWKDKDPLTYGADNTAIKVRKKRVETIIKETARYQNLYNKILQKTLDETTSSLKIDKNIRAADLERMLQEEKDPNYLKNKVKKNMFSDGYKKMYEKIMASSHWKDIKEANIKLEKAVQKELNTKVKMQVFAYNDARVRDTMMSPLDSIKYLRSILQTGVLVLDSKSGYVKAWVGGIDHNYFKFDHVHKGCERQIGSTIKPFVYSVSMEMGGLLPCDRRVDEEVIFEVGTGWNIDKDWSPKNSNGGYSGNSLTLKDALKQSKNSITARLLKEQRTPKYLVELLKSAGVDTDKKYPNGQVRVPSYPSICLGSPTLSVIEMTGAYTTFANKGKASKPIMVYKIVDRLGNVIYEDHPDTRSVMNEETSDKMLGLLKYSAGYIPGAKSEVGGKTGTTQNQTDGWFIGVTPDLTIGTWVGGEDSWNRFRDLNLGMGSAMAKPIFIDIIANVQGDPTLGYDKNLSFGPISPDIQRQLDCSSYLSNPEGEYDLDSNLIVPIDATLTEAMNDGVDF